MLMITWDAPKRQTNLAKHGLDFADLDEAFFLASVVVPAKAGRAGGPGQLGGASGGEGVEISMRPASARERSLL